MKIIELKWRDEPGWKQLYGLAYDPTLSDQENLDRAYAVQDQSQAKGGTRPLADFRIVDPLYRAKHEHQ